MTDHEVQERIQAIIEARDSMPDHICHEEKRLSSIIWTNQIALAKEYGSRRGFKYTGPPNWGFNLRALVECKQWTSSTHEGWSGIHSRYIDHPYYYRYQDKRAAAIVAHPYGIPDDVHEWARQNGIIARIPNFPSWWNPGGTNIIEYTATPETLARIRRERVQAENQAEERRALLEQYPPVFAVYDSIGKCDNQINRWSRECRAQGEPCVYVRRLSRYWMVGWLEPHQEHVDALMAIVARYWKRKRTMHPCEVSKGYIDGLTYPEALEAALNVYHIFKGRTSRRCRHD